ncbi:unnamed protein product [Coccothraustes coccothraustes]
MDFNRLSDLTNCHMHTYHILDFVKSSGKLPKAINAVSDLLCTSKKKKIKKQNQKKPKKTPKQNYDFFFFLLVFFSKQEIEVTTSY